MNISIFRQLKFYESILYLTRSVLRKFNITINFKECYMFFLPKETYKGVSTSNCIRLTLQDFEKQIQINPQWFTQKKIADLKHAFSMEGNIPYGLYKDDLLIAYGWISIQYIGLSERRLKKGDCYLWDDYTHPLYRGKGLHKTIIKIRLHEASKIGCNRVFSIVSLFNKSSSIGFKNVGFQRFQFFL